MGFTFISTGLHADESDMGKVFPQMDGWTIKDKAAYFTSDNLYEYINGAADVFLAYDFKSLASLSYINQQKHTFTVDVYLHGDPKNGFGIYTQEKPHQGDFLKIGSEGYYEKGILNFLKGSYYVKMSGYDMGDQDKTVLTAYAQKLAANLEGTAEFPAAAACFPSTDKTANSESYIAKNFLGHSFLHSAFVADYLVNGQKVQAFIIETEDNNSVDIMVKQYMDFLNKKNATVEQLKTIKGALRFQDPYYRSYGKMLFKQYNNHLYGLMCKDEAAAEKILTAIEAELIKAKLIK